jgi:formylglycine-generating enzyme required for sulfatase activity
VRAGLLIGTLCCAGCWTLIGPGAGVDAGVDAGVGTDADVFSASDFVRIEAGTYTIGSPLEETSRQSDESEHDVHITRSFLMAKFETTQAQYSLLMRVNPSSFSGSNRPVENVTWYDAVEFANNASQAAGLSPCYQISGTTVAWPEGLDCTGYRLPTEAEWEVAARAETDGPYAGGSDLDSLAWTASNANNTTHPVGEKAPNAWRLYDMSGNVWEWVWDGYAAYGAGTVVDPTGPEQPSIRVLRGGCWLYTAAYARLAGRDGYGPGERNNFLGFRLSRTVP